MVGATVHALAANAWALVRRQHGVIARWQLLELGFTAKAIEHRLAVGRLHRVHRGVYAVGRPDLTRKGLWMAAVLACGPGALLSHKSAAALLGLRDDQDGAIQISIPRTRRCRIPGLAIHRRHPAVFADATAHDKHP